jgi:hypothetical protein
MKEERTDYSKSNKEEDSGSEGKKDEEGSIVQYLIK